MNFYSDKKKLSNGKKKPSSVNGWSHIKKRLLRERSASLLRLKSFANKRFAKAKSVQLCLQVLFDDQVSDGPFFASCMPVYAAPEEKILNTI